MNNFKIFQQNTGIFQNVTAATGILGTLTTQDIKLLDPSHKTITFIYVKTSNNNWACKSISCNRWRRKYRMGIF